MISRRRTRGDETWERLLNWSDGQKASERLAAHLLASERFSSIDPSHPLGGSDGLKDIVCIKDGSSWAAACYFANGKKPFRSIYQKFISDAEILDRKEVEGFIFITNQYLQLGYREKLLHSVKSAKVDILHLERIAHILNRPENYGIRLEFLDIEMNKEELISFIATVAKQALEYKNLQQGFDELRQKVQDYLSEQGDKK